MISLKNNSPYHNHSLLRREHNPELIMSLREQYPRTGFHMEHCVLPPVRHRELILVIERELVRGLGVDGHVPYICVLLEGGQEGLVLRHYV